MVEDVTGGRAWKSVLYSVICFPVTVDCYLVDSFLSLEMVLGRDYNRADLSEYSCL